MIRPLPPILLMSKSGSVKPVTWMSRTSRCLDLREVDAFGAAAGYVGEGDLVERFARIEAGAINECRV
jgi:hypothetical protein